MADSRDIIILDDEPLITKMLARLLKNRHTVRFAHTFREALALIEERVPDVLLCDFQLKDGTADGFLRDVRDRWPATRIVLHSASRMEMWGELVTDGIIDRVLLKPASVQEILASMNGA
jgi:DNA-binding NtrC family response regulator